MYSVCHKYIFILLFQMLASRPKLVANIRNNEIKLYL